MSLGIGSLFATAIGTGMSMYGNYQQGQAQKQQAEYQAQVGRNQAESLRSDSRTNRMRMREDAKRRLARMKAGFASSGLVGATGTPLSMLDETQSKLELEIQDYSTQVGRKVQALEQGADIGDWSAGNYGRAGLLSAASSGITGLTNLAEDSFTYWDEVRTTNASPTLTAAK